MEECVLEVIQATIIGALIGGGFSLFTLLLTSKWRREDKKIQQENKAALEKEKKELRYLAPTIFELKFNPNHIQKIPLGKDKYAFVPSLDLKVIRGFVSEIIGFTASQDEAGDLVIHGRRAYLSYDVISQRIQEDKNTQYTTEILEKISLDQSSSDKFYYSTQYVLLKDHFGKTEWKIIFLVIDRQSLESRVELVWGEETLLYLSSSLPVLPEAELEVVEQVEVSFYLKTRLEVFKEIVKKYAQRTQ